jgi:hypothetical protein
MIEKRVESKKILSHLKVPYQSNLYGTVEHGFALRGDSAIKEVKFATDRAFEQALICSSFGCKKILSTSSGASPLELELLLSQQGLAGCSRLRKGGAG